MDEHFQKELWIGTAWGDKPDPGAVLHPEIRICSRHCRPQRGAGPDDPGGCQPHGAGPLRCWQTRSAAKPEQKLHEYCKSPQAGNPSDLWAFCLFSVLSASVFCPKAPVRCGWMLCPCLGAAAGFGARLRFFSGFGSGSGSAQGSRPALDSASGSGCTGFGFSTGMGAGGAFGTVFGFSAGTGAAGVSGTGWGAGAAPEAGGASGTDCGCWAALLSAAGFRSGRFQLPSFPMRSSSHMISSSLRVFWLRCRSSVSSSITLRPSPAGFHVGSSAESAGRSRSSGSGLSAFSGFFFSSGWEM